MQKNHNNVIKMLIVIKEEKAICKISNWSYTFSRTAAYFTGLLLPTCLFVRAVQYGVNYGYPHSLDFTISKLSVSLQDVIENAFIMSSFFYGIANIDDVINDNVEHAYKRFEAIERRFMDGMQNSAALMITIGLTLILKFTTLSIQEEVVNTWPIYAPPAQHVATFMEICAAVQSGSTDAIAYRSFQVYLNDTEYGYCI
jgi:hypothetical protein